MIEIGEIAFDCAHGEISAEVCVERIADARKRLFPSREATRRVWYRVAPEYAKYLTWERSDGFVSS